MRAYAALRLICQMKARRGAMEPTSHPFLNSYSQGVAPVPTQSTEISLEDETEALRNSPEWLTGIARRRLIQHSDFQMTLRRMKPNTRIPEHYNPGHICVQILFGYIRMHADGKSFDLRRGQCLVLDRAVVHDVESVEESAFLLTVARSEVGGN
jgi:quercetin dioxygenase-like cupin family protein